MRLFSVSLLCFTAFVNEGFAQVAVVLNEPPGVVMSIESQYVADIAKRTTDAMVIHPCGDGTFVTRTGVAVSLGDFTVLWIHHGEPLAADVLLRQPATIAAIRQHLVSGRGILLTGSAAILLEPLGLDVPQTQPMTFGHDREQFGLVPVDPNHPLFIDADTDRGVLWFSSATYYAFASFSAPQGKMIARNPGGPPAPLLEYHLEQGKLLAIPLRISPLYNLATEGYRQNFEVLTSNMLRYLEGTLPTAATPSKDPFEDDIVALQLAIENLHETFGEQYPHGEVYLARLNDILQTKDGVALEQLRREALLENNPLLDFDRLLLVRRSEKDLGLPMNTHSNSILSRTGYDNQLVLLDYWKTIPQPTTLYEPKEGRFVGDLKLHFDAERFLFSSINDRNRWNVFEMNIDGTGLRELPLIPDDDVDNFDACYLPDDGVVFCSTACFAGVPCVNGTGYNCNLYRLYPDGNIRQVTYEQDQNWSPTLLNNGRLLYQRWEYTDIPHAFSRILFHANPDGTNQSEYYGSGSYYPASMFYAKPIPDHPTKFVAIVGGHHELPRMGDLVLFDPSLGRREADGALQRIPGYGRKVEPVMLDLPIAQTWPKFLHPTPLNENFFIVSAKPSPEKPWGIYLVDVFDNIILIHEEPGYAMFEPIPVRKTIRPPSIPDRIDLTRQDADVFIADIYFGKGMQGVPLGSVKSIRVFSYQFGYQEMGAEPYSVGLDGPWDPRQILGTTPVHADGSVSFKIPAYTPFSIQPLDEEGKAIQMMRSWVTAMPGEVVSCSGCHEAQNTVPPTRRSRAAETEPVELTPWYGPPRGFSFVREVQPVLDAYCIECHHIDNMHGGNTLGAFSLQDGLPKPLQNNTNYINVKSRFSPSYYELRRFVRTPTKESDMLPNLPWEYHADTTRLVQLLQNGHHGIELDAEAWDRLITWIDFNAPFHGNWRDIIMDDKPQQVVSQFERRHEMRRRYTGVDTLLDDDPNVEYPVAVLAQQPHLFSSRTVSEAFAQRAASVGGTPPELAGNTANTPNHPQVAQSTAPLAALDSKIRLLDINLVSIPPLDGVPFWISTTEITNAQFAAFDPEHDSRIESGDFIMFSPGERGWAVNRPDQPVVRVSWNQAMEFCDWLSEQTGRKVTLPSVEQWEHACRAGTDTSFWYGDIDTDFSPFANLADRDFQQIDPFGWSGRRDTLPDWRPADVRFDDRSRVSAPVGSYRANPWGLYDMHGNVAEWTRSGIEKNGIEKRIVCGGSWYDVPARSRVGFRQFYRPEQPVFDVGFRIVVDAE
ncbi:MAG: SUMF1/EgtB/PvdO family nonheme iron enzyme [Planctomycetaceae bacterium]|nr:SUMF1/EgtB/PvdO family nonheme iron enzyme [Planctomycetaceae bacterium]